MTEQELRDGCYHNSIDVADGENEGKTGWFLRWRGRDGSRDDDEMCFVDESMLIGIQFGALRKFVVNGRDVSHITRVVGYFSHVENWNKSKIGELRDRQAGNYKVGEM